MANGRGRLIHSDGDFYDGDWFLIITLSLLLDEYFHILLEKMIKRMGKVSTNTWMALNIMAIEKMIINMEKGKKNLLTVQHILENIVRERNMVRFLFSDKILNFYILIGKGTLLWNDNT